MRTNIVLDDELVNEGLRLTGARTKKELVSLALQELVRSRRKRDLTGLAGKTRFYEGYDHKKLREPRRFDDPG